MRKEKKKLLLGEEFVENKSMKQGFYTEFKTLRECFNSWSYAKENIFNYYKNIITNNCDKVLEYGVRSYNSMIIVLHAIIEKEGKKYYLVITPSYNWFNELEA
jgi:hypothetical protein